MVDDATLSHFASLTGTTPETAQRYLSTANGDLESAVSTFFAAQEGDDQPAAPAPASGTEAATSTLPPGYVGPRTLSGAPAAADPWPSQTGQANRGANVSGFGNNTRPATAQQPAQRQTGVATLGSLSNSGSGGFQAGAGIGSNVHGLNSSSSGGRTGGPSSGTYRQGNIGRLNPDADDDSEPEDGPPNLYTGGERSGLSVRDPEAERRQRLLHALSQAGHDTQGPGGQDLANNILRQAQAGSQAPPPMGDEPRAPSAGGGHSWGRGRAINAEAEPEASEEQLDVDDDDEGEEEENELVVRHLIFWADGFTVEDSDLYRYDDPENQALLRAIQSQRAPNSVFNVRPDQQVDLHIERRMDQPYSPPPPGPMRAFAGQGNRLGSPITPGSASPAPAPAAAPVPPTAPAPPSTNAGPDAQPPFEVDTSQPVTTLQLRLVDGSKLVQKFNQSHTVGDVRRFLTASNPDTPAFILTTSFPPKALTDETETLRDAGLLNAVVIQKRA